MIQIRRALLLIIILICTGAVLFFGIRGYLLIRSAAELSGQELKLRSETVLYLSIVAALVILLLFALLLLHSRSISRELDKISNMTRYGNFSIAGSLKRIGPLGEKIQQLNRRLTDLNAMKSLRISSLNAVNAFLLNNSRLALLITDITGKVTNASARCMEKLRAEAGSVVGKHISELLPELDFQSSVAAIEKQHAELEFEDLKDTPTLYPVFNSANQLSNVICVLGREEIVSKRYRYGEENTQPGSRITSRVRNYFRGRRKRRKV